VDGIEPLTHRGQLLTGENLLQWSFDGGTVGDSQVTTQQQLEQRIAFSQRGACVGVEQVGVIRGRCVEIAEQLRPILADRPEVATRGIDLGGENRIGLGAHFVVRPTGLGQPLSEVAEYGVDHAQLVADRLLDIDPLDTLAIDGELIERDDHILVDFEGVGVARDGRGARTCGPESASRLGADSDETLAVTGIGQAHHLGGGGTHGITILTGDISQQHHFRPFAARRLGRVVDGAHVALVEVFEAGQRDTVETVEILLGFDDRRHGTAQVAAVELEADGAQVGRLRVQDENRRGNQAVTTLLLDARQTTERLVGNVLAKPGLAQRRPRELQEFRLTERRRAILGETRNTEGDRRLVVDATEVVINPLDLDPFGIGSHHAPADEVVERSAKLHRLLAAGIHRHVAADGRGVLRGRIDGENAIGRGRRFGNAPGDDTGTGTHGRDLLFEAGQQAHFGCAEALELLDVDHGGVRMQRNPAAGVTGTSAAWNDGQAEVDAGGDHGRDLRFIVGADDHQRELDPPVSSIGGVGDAGVTAKVDVVTPGDARQPAANLLTQLLQAVETVAELMHRHARGLGQAEGICIAVGTRHHLVEPVMHGVDQRFSATAVVEQVILQERVTGHHPEIAKNLEQHPGRATGAALATQPLDGRPGVSTKETAHDLAVRERRVIVRDLADPAGLLGAHIRLSRTVRKAEHSIILQCGMAEPTPAPSDLCGSDFSPTWHSCDSLWVGLQSDMAIMSPPGSRRAETRPTGAQSKVFVGLKSDPQKSGYKRLLAGC